MASGNTRGPEPRDPVVVAASQLARELDGSYGPFEQAVQAVLRAVISGCGEDDDAWDAVSVIVGLTEEGSYERHPGSAQAVRRSGAKLLAMLGNTVTSVGSNGQDMRLGWDVSYGFVAAMRTAYDELGAAVTALEADAAELVST